MKNEIIMVPEAETDRQRAFADAFAALPERPRTYHIVTFGCQMNAHDSEKLAGILESMGLTEAADKREADFVLHNTCCIRDNAERKALGNVTWLKEVRKERPEMLIGVCGCMVQQPGMADRLLRRYPFVDIAFGTGNMYELPGMLYRAVTEKRRVIQVPSNESTLTEAVPVRRSSDHSAYVTIMYGCNNYCSYCIVPYVRGRERSRRMEDILREVECLRDRGVKEIMLLGQNVNSYGADVPGASFPKLLDAVARTGIPRIRFMTSHPKDLSQDLINVIVEHENICRHFHLPVQSGSDRILKAMNRRYTRDSYMEKLRALRAAVPGIGVTTDIIVAFPGEEEQDFEDTLDLVREARYDSAFTFIYSPREGTAAAKMPGAVAPDVAADRISRLIALQEEYTLKALDEMVGQTHPVLVTGPARRTGGEMTGKCGRNISINFPGEKSLEGRIVPVRVTGRKRTTLRGEVMDKA